MAPVGEVTCTHDSEKNSDPASGSGNPQSNPASGSGCGSSPKLGLTDKSKEKPHNESSDSASSSRGSGSSKSSRKRSSSTASGSDKHAKKSNSKSSDDITSLADVQGAFSNTLREMMETQMAMFQSMLQQHRSCPDPVLVAGSSNGGGFPPRSEAEEGEEEEWSGAPPHLEPDMTPTPVGKRNGERTQKKPGAKTVHEVSESEEELDLDNDVAAATTEYQDVDKDGGPHDRCEDSDRDDDFDAALSQLLEDFGGDDVPGKPVNDKLADIVNKIVRAKLPKEKLTDKLSDEAYRRPANCQNLTVPKINPEMWDKVKAVRSADIKMQRLQTMLQKAMVPVILMYDDLRKYHGHVKPSKQQVGLSRATMAKYAADTLALLANLNWELTQARKDAIKPSLNGSYKQICSDAKPFTDLLFGDNLPATLRDIGATSRVSQAATASSGYNRYKKGPGSKNGPGRGQWQNRRSSYSHQHKSQNWQGRGYQHHNKYQASAQTQNQSKRKQDK